MKGILNNIVETTDKYNLISLQFQEIDSKLTEALQLNFFNFHYGGWRNSSLPQF